jgi:acetyl esterase/lipase
MVADHASEIGVDPQRLAVGGDSAGGLLAAWVAQKAAKNGPKRLQVLLYPNLDATTSRPSWKELGTGAYLVSHAEMIERYDAYPPHRRLNQRLCRVCRWAVEASAEVAPVASNVVTFPKRRVRKKGPAKMRGLLFTTCGAQSRDPWELMLSRLANGWA